MTETASTPEDECKAAAYEQYALIEAQSGEYGWQGNAVEIGDYLVIFIRIAKPQGRAFLLRLRCDDYPEVAPELRFVAADAFDDPTLDHSPAAEFYPKGDSIVAAGQRGPLPVPCMKGHRDYYLANWHAGWSNPPAHDHSPYQLVMNVRNAILDRWT